jgi:hypothetical protein
VSNKQQGAKSRNKREFLDSPEVVMLPNDARGSAVVALLEQIAATNSLRANAAKKGAAASRARDQKISPGESA